MVEFKGYLTGVAEKHFHKKSRIVGQRIILISILLLAPGILSFAIRSNDWSVAAIFAGAFTCIMLLTLIPKSKKDKLALTPKRIYIEDTYIVCIADRYEEIKNIHDVKCVYDHGEFYELDFPFGKISEKFICQKDLLISGTLDEFEKIFEGKIIRKQKKK